MAMERILARVCIFNCSMAFSVYVYNCSSTEFIPLEKGLRPEWLINACGSFTYVLLHLHEVPWAFTLIEMSIVRLTMARLYPEIQTRRRKVAQDLNQDHGEWSPLWRPTLAFYEKHLPQKSSRHRQKIIHKSSSRAERGIFTRNHSLRRVVLREADLCLASPVRRIFVQLSWCP